MRLTDREVRTQPERYGGAAPIAPTGLRRPPGPRGHVLTGNLAEVRRDPLGFASECARLYGDVVSVYLGPWHTYQLYHPNDIAYVLITNNRNFIKHPGMSMNRSLFGNGLLISEGDFWLRQRRLVQPAFHRERLASYGTFMVALAERLLATWKDGDRRDIHADMHHLTVQIVAKSLFDAEVEDEVRAVEAAQRDVMEAFVARYRSIFFLLSEQLPTPANLRQKRAARRLDAILRRAILRRRASGEDRGDLLSTLLQARDADDGSRMTDEQLRDEVMNLFLAGHETSADALSWTWYLLAQHPEVEANVQAELRDVLGGRAPTVADLPRLHYTEMVVTESLRLYPPLWIMGRRALGDCEIGGYRVPAGALIQMSPWVVHRDPRFYDEPEAFKPERWSDNLAKRLPRCAYFPFGAGPRLCIGNTFALMEVALVVATIAQRFRLTLAPGHVATPLPTMTLRPAHGVWMDVWRRPQCGP